MSDEELLERTREQPDAFGVFYRRHVDEVLRFFVNRTHSPHTAWDLTSETFTQALASVHRYRPTGAPATAWLYAIARRQLARLWRRGATSRRARERLDVPRIALLDEAIERIEALADLEPQRRALVDALSRLPPDVAAALELRVGHDLPYAEVGRRLGCSEGAARVRVSRGLAALADVMEGEA